MTKRLIERPFEVFVVNLGKIKLLTLYFSIGDTFFKLPSFITQATSYSTVTNISLISLFIFSRNLFKIRIIWLYFTKIFIWTYTLRLFGNFEILWWRGQLSTRWELWIYFWFLFFLLFFDCRFIDLFNSIFVGDTRVVIWNNYFTWRRRIWD